jgi:polyphenol oxidase
MIINVDSHCSIFFGDAKTCMVSCKDPEFTKFCDQLRQQLELEYLVFQYQTHGTEGWNIPQKSALKNHVLYKEREGDFLITNQQGIGIGALTADCLPIIFYDPEKSVVAIAHAGWRGSVAGIASVVVKKMNDFYQIDPAELLVYFGPAAQPCCYEVQNDFLSNSLVQQAIQKYPVILVKRDTKSFFDNSLLNKKELIAQGIQPEKINTQYNVCTICNHSYHSFRRLKEHEGYENQETIVWLK